MTREKAVSTLITVQYLLYDVMESYPELQVLLDRAADDVNLAGRVLLGEVEFSACSECGLTVEDGECPTGGNCDMQEAYQDAS